MKFFELTSYLHCTITRQLNLQEMMENPFIAADGFTYERYAIMAWLDRHNVSPVTKQKLQHKMLIPNHMLHSAIQEWKQRVKPA